jgi:hypothetical protein
LHQVIFWRAPKATACVILSGQTFIIFFAAGGWVQLEFLLLDALDQLHRSAIFET